MIPYRLYLTPASLPKKVWKILSYSVIFVLLLFFLPRASPLWLVVHRLSAIKFEQELVSGFLLTIGYVRQTVAAVDEEQRCVRAERDAFDQFATAVSALPTTTDTAVTGAPGPQLMTATTTTTGTQLQAVATAYRETVLAVPHYEESYDEPIAENMAAEFNETIATAVLEGQQLTPPLKRTLVAHALEAKDRRDRFLDTLQDERTAIDEAQTVLRDVDNRLTSVTPDQFPTIPFADLVSRDRILADERATCTQLLADRQQQIQNQNRQTARSTEPLIQQYLYQPLEVTFPVLTETLERIERIREQRRALIRSITRRV